LKELEKTPEFHLSHGKTLKSSFWKRSQILLGTYRADLRILAGRARKEGQRGMCTVKVSLKHLQDFLIFSCKVVPDSSLLLGELVG